MTWITRICTAALVACLPVLTLQMARAETAVMAVPIITIAPIKDGQMTISGDVQGTEGAEISGELTVIRKSGSNAMTSRQARDISLHQGDAQSIGSVSINVTAGDSVDATLVVRYGGIPVAESTLKIGLDD